LYLQGKYRIKRGKESLRSYMPSRIWAFLHAFNVRARGQERSSTDREDGRPL
jgi:hypothetical protein